MKKIFVQNFDESVSWQEDPVPAINVLPEWYKKMKTYTGNENKIQVSGSTSNLTIKKCRPFFDAISSGYYITLPVDVLVDRESKSALFTWKTEFVAIAEHNKEQIPGMPIDPAFYNVAFKWINLKTIETPKGYSTLFCHPMGRLDLPFYTLPGIVDTDFYKYPVSFPFFIKKDFSGIIKRGTPIAQVIPIKRDYWQMKKRKNLGELEKNNKLEKAHSFISNFYNKNFWQKKYYR
jgi:hypothetical protein